MKNKSFLRASLAALLVVVTVSSGIASGTHSFTDVPDGAFYTDAVAWAKANGMTTGSPAGSDTFKPLDGVTRGENITFAKRYDDIVVQPALDDRYTKAESDAAISGSNAIAFASSDEIVADDLSPLVPTTLLTLDITVPADGVVIVNGNANILADTGIAIDCWVNIDDPAKNSFHGVQHGTTGMTYVDEWADNLGFEVTAGDHILYLGCQQMNGIDADVATIQVRRMTAVFSANGM